MSVLSPYESDIEEQPSALRRLLAQQSMTSVKDLELASYTRIVLTGMGSSHFAAAPLWRALIGRSLPAWWLSTAQLLDAPHLVTADTLLIATSQSGRSGEIVALTEGAVPRPKTLLAVTDDLGSPLARSADLCLEIHSGPEATVSAKSYLNTLTTHHRLLAHLTHGNHQQADSEIAQAATDLEGFDCAATMTEIAAKAVAPGESRIAFVGAGDDAATSLMGGLVVKEAVKIPAEGFTGGEFRHGPLEIAGPGLLAVIFMGPSISHAGRRSLEELASDLTLTGSQVLIIGDHATSATTHVAIPDVSPLGFLLLSTKAVQVLSVKLASALGIEPGVFLFGEKITARC